MSMNICIFSGRTTRDVELRYAEGKPAVGRFGFAVDTGFGDNKKTSFLNITAFGKTAEALEKYAPKGTKLLLQCAAIQNSYTNKEGNKVSDVQFIVNSWEFGESKNSNGTQNQNKSTIGDGFMNIPDGIDTELPFV